MIYSHIQYNMAYTEVTEAGKAFLIDYANKQPTNSLLQGNNGEFPFSINVPINKTWKSNPKKFNSNTLISSNTELMVELIKYYEHYSKILDLDANFMLAQAYQESMFNVWIYAPKKLNSSASGIGQFLMISIYEHIIKNKYKPSGYDDIIFTNEEISRITNGISEVTVGSDGNPIPLNDLINNPDYFKPAKTINAQRIRPILHQNLIDNLDIMVKAHCRYMRYNLSLANNYIATALFCYNRGFGYIEKNFKDTINKYLQKNNINDSGYKEGSEYVLRIFKLVSGKFGYNDNRKLDLTKKYDPFID